jgi:hypothetical protein
MKLKIVDAPEEMDLGDVALAAGMCLKKMVIASCDKKTATLNIMGGTDEDVEKLRARGIIVEKIKKKWWMWW